MVMSRASTVREYLAELPRERRAVVSAVRDVVRRHLPAGYRETMNWGMITWELPLSRYPDTYNGQPLCYVALAAQKNYNALYLTGDSQDSEQETLLKKAFRDAGKKLGMGKSCLRFQALEDLALDAIGRVVAATSPEEHIARHEANRKRAGAGRAKKTKASGSRPARSSRKAPRAKVSRARSARVTPLRAN